MCWVDKCCYFVPLDYACILVGGGSLVLSTIMAGVSIVFLMLEENNRHWQKDYLKYVLQLEIKEISIEIILWIVLILNLLSIIASVLLLVGLKMNKPNLVITYFGFGTLATILILLSALLGLLQNFWVFALVEIIASMIFIHFLVVVHTVYELMLKGKHFGLNQHRRLDEEPFAADLD